MALQSSDITTRCSRGQNNSNTPPIEVRSLALMLEAEPPRKLWWDGNSSTDEINALLHLAVNQKLGNVDTAYTFDHDSILVAHEIDPNDPGEWTDQSGTRGVTVPAIDAQGVTYYVGFSI